jgi:hypothetical protein
MASSLIRWSALAVAVYIIMYEDAFSQDERALALLGAVMSLA